MKTSRGDAERIKDHFLLEYLGARQSRRVLLCFIRKTTG